MKGIIFKSVVALLISASTGTVVYMLTDALIPTSIPIRTTILEATRDHVIYKNEFIRQKKCKSQIDRFIYRGSGADRERIHRDTVPGDPEMVQSSGHSRIDGLHLEPDVDYELRVYITLFCTFVTDQRGYPPVLFRVDHNVDHGNEIVGSPSKGNAP